MHLVSSLTPNPNHYQHAHMTMKRSKSLGRLSVLPRELRDNIYAYLVPVVYNTLWYTVSNGEAPAFVKSKILRARRSDHTKLDLSVLPLSKVMHEEAVTVLYSQGIFRFSSPYYVIRDTPDAVINIFGSRIPIRRHRMGAFPDTNITSRIMNVELSYNPDLDVLLSMKTEKARQFNLTTSLCSASPDPVALFSGNSVQRKSALIKFRISELSDCPTEIISSPLFNVLKQLTGFRTFILKVSIWMEPGNNRQMDQDYGSEKLGTGLERLLSELTVALEPTLGHGATSKLESAINGYWG